MTRCLFSEQGMTACCLGMWCESGIGEVSMEEEVRGSMHEAEKIQKQKLVAFEGPIYMLSQGEWTLFGIHYRTFQYGRNSNETVAIIKA